MSKLLLLLLLAPVTSLCQCPKWIGGSTQAIAGLKGLMEQRLSFKFADSCMAAANDRWVCNSTDGRFVLKITHRQGIVQDLNLEAPTTLMETFAEWSAKTFNECTVSTNGGVTAYENFVVLTRPISKTRSYFYMSRREQ